MNNVEYLKNLIQVQKNNGVPLQQVAWNAARACVGWPYVYGAVGEECKPAKRAQYGTKFYPKDHTSIVTKCNAISWDSSSQTCKVTGNCSKCKWNLPVMMFDCRGFTRKILNMVYSWTLMGGTVGGQWNDEKNWKAKGEIATMPKDTLSACSSTRAISGIILASATTTRLSRPAAACSISARGIKNGRTGPSRCAWKEV